MSSFSIFSFFSQEGKVVKSSSGFSGKGFKFDETEHALATERKKLQRAALGLQDSDDEDGALDVRTFQLHLKLQGSGRLSVPLVTPVFLFFLPKIEEKIESMFNSKKRVKDMSAPGSGSGGSGAVASPAAGVTGALPGFGPTSAGNIQKLEMAKRLALKINAQKNLGAEAQVGC